MKPEEKEKSARVTPLREIVLADGAQLWIKDETAQLSGAFKFRGSYNFLSALDPNDYKAELVTASTGNHAIGLSTSARIFGLPVRIFVPENTPKTKLQRIEDAGGKVTLVDGSYEDALAHALAYATENDALVVPSYDHPNVMQGHQAIFSEIETALGQAPAQVYVPVGGGGLLGAAISGTDPQKTAVIGAEFIDFKRVEQVVAGQIDEIAPPKAPPPPSVEGIAVRSLGKHPLEVIRKAENFQVTQVTYDEMRAALRLVWKQTKVRAELASCASVAAAMQRTQRGEGPNVCVITGGNIDPGLHQELVS